MMDLPHLLALLEAHRAEPDQALRNMIEWAMTRQRLAEVGREAILRDFRARSPQPVPKPALLFL